MAGRVMQQGLQAAGIVDRPELSVPSPGDDVLVMQAAEGVEPVDAVRKALLDASQVVFSRCKVAHVAHSGQMILTNASSSSSFEPLSGR